MISAERLRKVLFVTLLLFGAESLIAADEQCSPESNPLRYYNSGTVSSPNYPDEYPNNADCHWHITSTTTRIVSLKFDSFLTEYYYDKVSIYNGNDTSATLIEEISGDGWNLADMYTTTQPHMYIRFKTSSTRTYTGFTAHFWASLSEPCNSELDPLVYYGNGTFSTPLGLHSGRYPHNANCNWRIVSTSRIVALTFTSFETETNYDKVYLYDGNSTRAELIDRLSGSVSPSQIFSTSQSAMFIKFTSDSTISNDGFTAQFWSLAVAPTTETTESTSTGDHILWYGIVGITIGASVGFVLICYLLGYFRFRTTGAATGGNDTVSSTSPASAQANRPTQDGNVEADGNTPNPTAPDHVAYVHATYDNAACDESVNEDHNSTKECIICFNAAVNSVFIDCGHMATCMNCGKQLEKCPICRRFILSVQRVFPA